MLNTLTFILLVVFVFCDDISNAKLNLSNETEKAQFTNGTNTTTPRPLSNEEVHSVSEGLKAVTDGAKQIINGVIEVGSSIINAITKWFEGGLKV